MTHPANGVLLDRKIPSEPSAGRDSIQQILEQLENVDWLAEHLFGIHLALEEAVTNAIKHGNSGDKTKSVFIRCEVLPTKLCLEIADEGPGFNPANVPDCTDDDRLDVPSGRGLALMRNFMSEVKHNKRGNKVMMEKHRPDCSKQSA